MEATSANPLRKECQGCSAARRPSRPTPRIQCSECEIRAPRQATPRAWRSLRQTYSGRSARVAAWRAGRPAPPDNVNLPERLSRPSAKFGWWATRSKLLRPTDSILRSESHSPPRHGVSLQAVTPGGLSYTAGWGVGWVAQRRHHCRCHSAERRRAACDARQSFPSPSLARWG